jgi:NADH:ubiquinone oxidoreductase subunit 6 (subunit J)
MRQATAAGVTVALARGTTHPHISSAAASASASIGDAMTAFYPTMFVLPAAIIATAIVLARLLTRRER